LDEQVYTHLMDWFTNGQTNKRMTHNSYLHLGSEDNGEEWEDDTDNESVVYV